MPWPSSFGSHGKVVTAGWSSDLRFVGGRGASEQTTCPTVDRRWPIPVSVTLARGKAPFLHTFELCVTRLRTVRVVPDSWAVLPESATHITAQNSCRQNLLVPVRSMPSRAIVCHVRRIMFFCWCLCVAHQLLHTHGVRCASAGALRI